MGFKTRKTKYYIIRRDYADKKETIVNNEIKIEITEENLLDLSFGIKDYKLLSKLIDLLKGIQ